MSKLASWWRKFKCKKNWHDYPDSDKYGYYAMHFYVYRCRHCNKEFNI